MSTKDEEFFKKLQSIYKMESKERIQEISNNLMALEKAKSHSEQRKILDAIFREIHSLKSASRSVNLSHIENIFKFLEDVYSILKAKNITPTSEHLDILHKINDIIDNLINVGHDRKQSLPEESKVSLLFQQLKDLELIPRDFAFKIVEDQVPLNPIPQEMHKEEDTVRISSEKVNTLLANAEEMLTTRLSLVQIINDITSFKNEVSEDIKRWEKIYREKNFLIDESFELKNNTRQENSRKKSFIEFMEWSEDSSKIIEKKLIDITSRLEHDLHAFSHCVDNLLDDTKKLLLWPFSTILNVLPRIVRDLSHNANKEVEVNIEGSEVEIDKRILEAMRDVILHLVRNAIDHGIEIPEIRKNLNKPEHGLIKISVKQISGNEIMITISDDGAGINVIQVKKSAIKQGIITEDFANAMTDTQALNLIYHSGVSTSEILTDLSGRGLGMAIIRDKIEQIGGEISLTSNPNMGSTFTIKLPLTLATFKGLLIEVASQQFLIPTANIERVLRIEPSSIKTVENTETIFYEGKTMSLVWLSYILGVPRNENISPENENQFLPVIIISSADKKIAFVVNNILNEQEILVKNFSKPLLKVKNISAAAIASSGKTIPILNCLDLLQTAKLTTQATQSPSIKEKHQAKNNRLLLVEDSFTTRTLLKNILELGGYQVSVATDGLDAWSTLKTNDYALVVSDIEMPRMNGFQLTQKIRNDKKLSDLPVILITSRESQEDKEQGIDSGANAYLPKSTFDSGRLLEIIKRLHI